ncbi:MAG: sensor histidine kinase [Spirochaetaceae bacterium]|nr:sensor histidine kinase [Spirochaetaceae bacterium]
MHFTLSDLVTDITQNAAESGASLVELDVLETPERFRFTLKDNGKGMDQDEMRRALDPFGTDGEKHPHRKVGLGIPFLIQTAEQSGGGWDLKSEKHVGTTVMAWFDVGNVDTPPVGDLPGMFRTILLFPGPREMYIRRSRKGGKELGYTVKKSELLDVLGDLDDGGSLVLLDRYLRSMEEGDEADN